MSADRRRRLAAWLGAVIVGVALAVMPAASPASATPPVIPPMPATSPAVSPEQQAAQEVAASRCAKMRAQGTIPDRYKDDCEKRLEEDLLSGKAGKPNWLDGLCLWVPDLPIFGNPCQNLLSIMRGAWEEFQGQVKEVRGAVDAITNPVETLFKNFSETISNALQSLIEKVFPELIHISSPNLASKGFRSAYAAGAGLAMFVLVGMLVRLFVGVSQDDITGAELGDALWRWVPVAMLAVVFGPGFGYLLVSLSDAASAGILNSFSGDITSLIAKLQNMIVLGDASGLPGGPLVGAGIELVALIGLIGVVGGMLVQLLTLYLTGMIMAVAFVMLIDPRTRKKAAKVPVTWLGLLIAKPLLFFFIGGIARIADSAFTVQSIKDDGIRSLVTAVVAAMALFILGLAPWTLLKFGSAVMPDGSSSRIARSSRSQSSGALGGLANSVMMQVAYGRRASGGEGGTPSPATAAGGPGGGSAGGPDSPTGQPVSSRQSQAQRVPAGGSGRSGTTPIDESPAAAGTPAPAAGGAGPGAAVASTGAGGGAAGGAAAGGGGGAAVAGAGAATGGIGMAALLGVQVADAANRKARDAAHRASDMTAED